MAITSRADGLILCSAGDTYTLPNATGKDGFTYRIKNTGTADVTVNTTSSQTIDGKLTWAIKPGQCAALIADAGNWIGAHNATAYSHATFRSPSGLAGRYHDFGYYSAPATSKSATQAAATQTWGTANVAYGAKTFIVAAGAGTASGGTTGVGKITVSGTSVSDDGVRVAGDSEVIVADTSALTANQYAESHKYWIGQVTFTLGQTGDRTAYACTFNYGFAKYFEFDERKVVVASIEATGRAGANDTGFNIELLKHDGTGWTYHATAFVPGGAVIAAMATDYVVEKNLSANERFGWERYSLGVVIDGAAGNQGVVVRVTTGANNAVETMDCRIRGYIV